MTRSILQSAYIRSWLPVLILLAGGLSLLSAQTPKGQFVNVRPIPGAADGARHHSPYVSANGLELYYSSDFGHAGPLDFDQFDTWRATRTSVDQPFENAERLSDDFNTDGVQECCPKLTADGLVFIHGNSLGGDILSNEMVATRPSLNADWGPPMPLTEFVDIEAIRGKVVDFWDPEFSSDLLSIYFTGGTEQGLGLFVSHRDSVTDLFEEPTPLAINTTEWEERNASISSDELTLFYMTDRGEVIEGGFQHELWVATRNSTDQEFDNAMPINDWVPGSQFNTDSTNESNPFISHDWPAAGSKFYFTLATNTDDVGSYEATWVPVVEGDYNENGQLDAADLDLQSNAMKNENPDLGIYDENGDSRVDLSDRLIWVQTYAGTWVGDSNLDGEFDSSDFVAIFQAGKYETGELARWSEGDWNGDEEFNSVDFVTAFRGGGFGQGPRAAANAVPEPACILMLMVGLIGIAIHRRHVGQ